MLYELPGNIIVVELPTHPRLRLPTPGYERFSRWSTTG